MPLLHAIILGITQGLSEVLPISSSGHLALVPWLFGWDDFAGTPELETTFDVALHLGTLAGAVAYFRSDVARLASAGLGALRPGPVRAGIGSVSNRVRPADRGQRWRPVWRWPRDRPTRPAATPGWRGCWWRRRCRPG